MAKRIATARHVTFSLLELEVRGSSLSFCGHQHRRNLGRQDRLVEGGEVVGEDFFQGGYLLVDLVHVLGSQCGGALRWFGVGAGDDADDRRQRRIEAWPRDQAIAILLVAGQDQCILDSGQFLEKLIGRGDHGFLAHQPLAPSFHLFAYITQTVDRAVGVGNFVAHLQEQRTLRLQVGLGDLDTRVVDNRERVRVALVADAQAHLIVAGDRQGAFQRFASRLVASNADGSFVA